MWQWRGNDFSTGGQAWCVTQPFQLGVCKPPSAARGRAPEANAFGNNLLKINLKSGLWIAVYTPNSDPISDVRWLVGPTVLR